MTALGDPMVATFATVALVLAVADWFAVWLGSSRMRFVTKPGAMIALVVVAVSLEPASESMRAVFVAALALSLAGDVFLLWSDRWFRAGLTAFLLAHIAYTVGFSMMLTTGVGALIGLAVVAVGLAAVARRILSAVRDTDARLVLPVSAYMTVISVMVVAAATTGSIVAFIGALLFYVSDSILAWDRFVQPNRILSVLVMVTYHAAQAGLVISLL